MALILVVEDDPEINSLMALTLRVENYDVAQARDGAQGIKLASERLPDLILLDVMMPRLSGYDVANALSQTPETKHIPIIFVTAKSEMEDRVRGLEMGFDYVCKPFAASELLARVRVALRMRKLQEELRVANEQLAQVATMDSLTGLCNRRQFNRELEDELHRAARFSQSLSLLTFDIDFFKTVNDRWGHAQGDEVLRAFAQVLEDTKRSIDTVARLGGEEFAALLPATGHEGARAFAEKVRVGIEQMQMPLINGEDGEDETQTVGVTVSCGAAVLEHPENKADETTLHETVWVDRGEGKNIVPAEVLADAMNTTNLSPLARELMHSADLLLYRAKTEGRNRVVSSHVEFPDATPESERVR